MGHIKTCRECNTKKPNYMFHGTDKICNICYNEKYLDRISKDPVNYNKRHILKKYNLTAKQYENMFKDQLGRCSICEQPHNSLTNKLCVDHCHTSGIVRSLLCGKCNTALGLLKEDEDILLKMLEYIKRFEHLKFLAKT